MHSLFLRIFLLFLLAMTLIVGSSIATTFTITSRENEPFEYQRRPSVAIQASEILARGGVGALKSWLEGNKTAMGDRELFIIGPDGRDILGRRLPESAARRLEFINREPVPGNFRPSRAAPQIIAPDGSIYTVVMTPRRPSIFGALSLPAISLTILGIALVVSALTSWWLAEHLTAPIRRIQAGARALASENLDVRVSAGLEGRKDELAVLARDFDAMADQLRANRGATTQLLARHIARAALAAGQNARRAGPRAPAPADFARQLDRLEREIERLDSMISQVLKLARLHGTDALLERERFELDDVIEEVVRDANFEGAVKNCRINLRGAANNTPCSAAASCCAARSRMYCATPCATARATRRWRCRSRAGAGGLEIVIRDHGPGVPAADLERIFEPFYRVAESRDRDSGGEGIGLAITSQVMKAHGGSARAVNASGGGLQVRLSLPETAIAV